MQGQSRRYLGNALQSRRVHQRAVLLYDKAIANDPDLTTAYFERGILLWRELNEPELALVDLDTAVKLYPNYAEAYFFRGMVHQALGQFKSAIRDLLRYIGSDHPTWQRHAIKQLELLRAIDKQQAQKA